MHSEPPSRTPADAACDGAERINIHEGAQRRDWAARLGTTQLRIVEAVKTVGPLAANVRRFLSRYTSLQAAERVAAGRR